MPPDSWVVFFEWCEATWPGRIVRESIWLFSVLEAVHLVALCVLGGAVILVDLRLLGHGLRGVEADALARFVRPWLLGALSVMLATGVLLFLSEAIKCFYNTSFWVKMLTLPVALGFTFLVKNRALRAGPMPHSLKSRVLGLTSLALWLTVAAAGRWIGYS